MNFHGPTIVCGVKIVVKLHPLALVPIWTEISGIHGELQLLHNLVDHWPSQDLLHSVNPKIMFFIQSLDVTVTTLNCTWVFIHSVTWFCGHGALERRKKISKKSKKIEILINLNFLDLIQSLMMLIYMKSQAFGVRKFWQQLERTISLAIVTITLETSMDLLTITWLESMVCSCHTHWNWQMALTLDIHKREFLLCHKKHSLDIVHLVFLLAVNMDPNKF